MAAAANRLSRFNVTALALGLAFLYLPIVILIIYSFNASRLVTVWGGWSLHWYCRILQRQRHDRCGLDEPAGGESRRRRWRRLLGTLAAIALSRGASFTGRTLFSGMLYAPLVMPEVITGLSLLLLFVAINAERGFWTVVIAHTTLTMCFVAVVVQARLGAIDPQPGGSRDGSRLRSRACVPLRDLAADPAFGRCGMDAGLYAVARRSRDRELHHRARARRRCRSGSIRRCGSA